MLALPPAQSVHWLSSNFPMPVLQVGKIVFHDVPKQVGWEQGGISDSRLRLRILKAMVDLLLFRLSPWPTPYERRPWLEN